MPVETETFNDSFSPRIGISRMASLDSRASELTPSTSFPTTRANLSSLLTLKLCRFRAFGCCSNARILNPSILKSLILNPKSFESMCSQSIDSAPSETFAKSFLLLPKRSTGAGVVPTKIIFATPKPSAVRKIEAVFSTLRRLSSISTQVL